MNSFGFVVILLVLGALVNAESEKSSNRDARTFFSLIRGSFRNQKCGCDFEYRYLRNQNFIQDDVIEAIQQILADNAPRCPLSAIGARRISDYCYSIEHKELGFADAQRYCKLKGGKLAEPPVENLKHWFKHIREVFKKKIDDLAGNPYIGLRNEAYSTECHDDGDGSGGKGSVMTRSNSNRNDDKLRCENGYIGGDSFMAYPSCGTTVLASDGGTIFDDSLERDNPDVLQAAALVLPHGAHLERVNGIRRSRGGGGKEGGGEGKEEEGGKEVGGAGARARSESGGRGGGRVSQSLPIEPRPFICQYGIV